MVLGQSFHYFLKNTCLTEIHQKGVDHNLGVEIFPLTWCVWLVLRYSGRTASSLGTVIRGAQRWTASWAASRWTTRRSTSGPTSCQHGMCNNTDMFSFYVFLMHFGACFAMCYEYLVASNCLTWEKTRRCQIISFIWSSLYFYFIFQTQHIHVQFPKQKTAKEFFSWKTKILNY